MSTLSGHCLCKTVRFFVSGPIIRAGHCHCESCRRATSSPLTTFFSVARDDVIFEGGSLRHYASSPGVSRGFCSTCGSPLSYETTDRPDEIDLFVGALADASGVPIAHHWFWSERVSWLACDDDLPKHD